MNSLLTLQGLTPWLATDTPVLPAAWLMQWSLPLGWSVVLACLGAMLGWRRWPLPVVLAIWAWLPGAWGASYWLGLAFQAPSIVTVLWCGALLAGGVGRATVDGVAPRLIKAPCDWALPLGGVVLGWALLLDTLALLPLPLYAWGFSPVSAALVLLLALLPWVWRCHASGLAPDSGRWLWLTPVAVLLFVLLRLPSGNVWDAVLDPWLWLGLQVHVLRRLWIRYKNNSL